jgi:hypothetical protein
MDPEPASPGSTVAPKSYADKGRKKGNPCIPCRQLNENIFLHVQDFHIIRKCDDITFSGRGFLITVSWSRFAVIHARSA